MSMSPEQIAFVRAEYKKFYDVIKQTDPLYDLGQDNFSALVDWIREQRLPEAQWNQHVFSAAYVAQKAAGKIKSEKSKEEIHRERTAEYAARDREAGLRTNNTGLPETEGDGIERLKAEKARADLAQVEELKSRLASAEEAAAKANDLSVVPSVKQLFESIQAGVGELRFNRKGQRLDATKIDPVTGNAPIAEGGEEPWSKVQIAHYAKNFSEARRQVAEARARKQ
jgi:hypothetical protein